MNVYLLIILNIILVSCIAYFIVDHQHQFVPYKTETQCIKTNTSNRLCAQCFKRDQLLLHHRGVKIQSNKQISILKIKDLQTYLTCHDYLQLINTQNKEIPHQKIIIESATSIFKLLSQINGILQVENDTFYHIQPWYNQLVIYRYEQKAIKESSIVFPNPEHYNTIKFCFLIGFNFTLLFISFAMVAGKILPHQQEKLVNILFVCIAILMELFVLDVESGFCLFLARVIVLNLGFIFLGMDYFRIMLFFAIGLFLRYHQLNNLIYIILVFIIMICYAQTPNDTQTYLFAMYTLILINHLYLYNYTLYLNDFRNIVIDVCLIISIPLGLIIVSNQELKAYQQVNSENKPNELSEYQQQPSKI